MEPHSLPDEEIDKILNSGLSREQRLKVRAVEQAIKISIGKNLPLTDFTKYFQTIYDFYVNN
jgi:hypothetical protein